MNLAYCSVRRGCIPPYIYMHNLIATLKNIYIIYTFKQKHTEYTTMHKMIPTINVCSFLRYVLILRVHNEEIYLVIR
jgi:hypothetical protein